MNIKQTIKILQKALIQRGKDRGMREIIFRGKRVDNGEWIRGDLITTPFIRRETQKNIIYILDVTKADYDCFEDLVEDNGIFEVAPETVCQYTSLTDKNGRKIFEGDIVKSDLNKIGKIVFNESHMAFTILEKEENRYYYIEECDGDHIEVIGNIFDNPEMIRGEAERGKEK